MNKADLRAGRIDLTATFPSGAISDRAPSTGFSAITITRSGAPVQGANGAGKTVTSPHASDAAAAGVIWKNPTAISENAVAAAAKQRPGSIRM